MNVVPAMKAVIKRGEEYLILEHVYKGKVIHDFPGGRVEYGESPYACLQRKVKEETDLDIDVGHTLGVYWFFRESDKTHVVCTTFLCVGHGDVDNSHALEDEHIIGHRWMTKDDLLALPLHESMKKLIKHL